MGSYIASQIFAIGHTFVLEVKIQYKEFRIYSILVQKYKDWLRRQMCLIVEPFYTKHKYK